MVKTIFYGKNIYTKIAIEYTKIAIEYTKIAIEYTKIAIEYTKIAIKTSKNGYLRQNGKTTRYTR
jgi:hypothetical protein